MRSLLLILTLTCLCYAATNEKTRTVEIWGAGDVEGYLKEKSWVFYEIPYSKKPERWQPSTEFAEWEGVRKLKESNSACPQCLVFDTNCTKEIEEDCLHLNIFVPKSWDPNGENKFKTMLFIHGGAFVFGSARQYDSSDLCEATDKIIVTINYRLGVLGYLRSKDNGILGNMGITDQQMAIKWVDTFIHHFGGDGDITLFGQSAGAMSAGIHMVAPIPDHPIENVIMESNAWSFPYLTSTGAETSGKEFTDEVEEHCSAVKGGVDSKECLQIISVAKILEIQKNLLTRLSGPVLFYPIIDGEIIKEHPEKALNNIVEEGKDLPNSIMGTTTREGYPFVLLLLEQLEQSELDTIKIVYNNLIREYKLQIIEEIYGKPQTDEEIIVLLTNFFGDHFFVCPTIKVSRLISNKVKYLNWHYRWNKGTEIKPGKCSDVACHSAELYYVFGHMKSNEKELSRLVQTYWGNLAKHGKPDGKGEDETWPEFSYNENDSMYFDHPESSIKQTDVKQDEICEKLKEINFPLTGEDGTRSHFDLFNMIITLPDEVPATVSGYKDEL